MPRLSCQHLAMVELFLLDPSLRSCNVITITSRLEVCDVLAVLTLWEILEVACDGHLESPGFGRWPNRYPTQDLAVVLPVPRDVLDEKIRLV